MAAVQKDTTARGTIIIHAAPAALCPHIEWAIGRALEVAGRLDWDDQPAMPGRRRAECAWQGAPGTGAAITSALAGWDDVAFEVTEDASDGNDAGRWMRTSRLGIAYAPTDNAGNILVSEDRIRFAIETSGHDIEQLRCELRTALCEAWDEELEPLRHASDTAKVVRLHKAG